MGKANGGEAVRVELAVEGTKIVAPAVLIGRIMSAPQVRERGGQEDQHAVGFQHALHLDEKRGIVVEMFDQADRQNRVKALRCERQAASIREDDILVSPQAAISQGFFGSINSPHLSAAAAHLVQQGAGTATDVKHGSQAVVAKTQGQHRFDHCPNTYEPPVALFEVIVSLILVDSHCSQILRRPGKPGREAIPFCAWGGGSL